LTEDEILLEIDELDKGTRILDRFYDLCDKLSVKVLTIEEVLEQERIRMQEESKNRL
jgi:hypothetical protein